MIAFIPRLAHRLFGAPPVVDAAPMGSPDPAALDALAVSTPVLSMISVSLATYSPDQAHELGYGLGRS
jgi:hypothetical protein